MPSNRNYGPSGAPGAPSASINTVLTNTSPLPATITNNLTTEQVVNNPALPPNNPLLVQIPSQSILDGKKFSIVASGSLNVAAAENVTIKMYSGTSETVGSDTLLATSTAEAFAGAASGPWIMTCDAAYDTITGKLGGTCKFLMANQLVAEAVFSNVITGIAESSNPILSFLLSVQFSVANAANSFTVRAFDVNF